MTTSSLKRSYGLPLAFASPRNGKDSSRIFDINEAERRAQA